MIIRFKARKKYLKCKYKMRKIKILQIAHALTERYLNKMFYTYLYDFYRKFLISVEV
jgi:hypothetical protein